MTLHIPLLYLLFFNFRICFVPKKNKTFAKKEARLVRAVSSYPILEYSQNEGPFMHILITVHTAQ
jgi:hypothetical protein